MKGISYESFFEFEEKYSLHDKLIDGIPCWELVRFKVFIACTQVGSRAVKEGSKSKKILTRDAFDLFTKRNPFFARQKKILFLNHPRKIKRDDSYIDMYTDPLLSLIRSEEYLVLDKGFQGRHFPSTTPNLYYTDILVIISKILRGIYFFKLKEINDQFFKFLGDVEILLEKEFGLMISLHEARSVLQKFFLNKILYKLLLRKLRPQKIFLVVSYGNEDLIAAAKALNIKVIEIQHGIISVGHAGYNFPTFKKVFFPDELWVFGKAWVDGVALPIPRDNIKVIGFHYLNAAKKLLGNVVKEDVAVFISQWTIGEELSKYAVQFFNEQKIKTIYKLHPQEYFNWREKYPWLLNSGVEVVAQEKSLYSLLSSCKWVFGVHSTVLFESLSFGCKTFVLNLPGWENLKNLLDLRLVTLIDIDLPFRLDCLTEQKLKRTFDFFHEVDDRELFDLIMK